MPKTKTLIPAAALMLALALAASAAEDKKEAKKDAPPPPCGRYQLLKDATLRFDTETGRLWTRSEKGWVLVPNAEDEGKTARSKDEDNYDFCSNLINAGTAIRDIQKTPEFQSLGRKDKSRFYGRFYRDRGLYQDSKAKEREDFQAAMKEDLGIK